MSRRKISIASLALPKALLGEIRALIESARQRATATVNSELTFLFWRIGRRIHTEVLAGERAGYGEQIVPVLAAQLTRDYGQGFAEKSLRRMVQFAATFPDEQIVATLSRLLSWSHFVLLLPLKDPLQREYYAQMCSAERWSVRTLRGRIDSMLYERTALSRQPDASITQELATMRDTQRMSPNLVMRDPYPRLSRTARHLAGKRPGSGHHSRNGIVPAGVGHRLHFRRPPEADSVGRG